MTLNKEEIAHLATLSRIELKDTELEQFSENLPQILNFVGQLDEVNVNDALHNQVVEIDQLRTDTVNGSGLTLEQLQNLAPALKEYQVVVPAVFEERNAK